MDLKLNSIHKSDQLEVLSAEYGGKNTVGIKYNVEKAMILPYICDESGVPISVGIIKEFNPFREGNYSETLVSGTVYDEDDNNLDTAIRACEHEIGYRIVDEFRWDYLGSITGTKVVDAEHPCYAVNITDMTPVIKKDAEKKDWSTFSIIPISKAIHSHDAFVLSLVFKLYTLKFSNVFGKKLI